MAGIKSFGIYLPLWRLPLSSISPRLKGEKAVAGSDEDSVTMAVAAALECLKGRNRMDVDGLIFSTTTPPYAEKQLASLIAAAVDLRKDIFTLDMGGSLKSGTDALLMGVSAVKAGTAKNVLVVAADCRLASPGSMMERVVGDGAAAVLVGEEDVVAVFEESYSLANEMMDVWRGAEQKFVQAWEERFVSGHGYMSNTMQAIKGLMGRQGLKASDYNRVALYSPDMRSPLQVAKALEFDLKTQVLDPCLGASGNIGCPQPLLLLAEGLRGAGEGQRLMVAGYGGGANALSFRTTKGIGSVANTRGLNDYLGSKKDLSNYVSYLKLRGLIEFDPPKAEFGTTESSATSIWRERDQIFGLKGAKCKSCGTVQFPPQRICVECHSKDQFDPVRLAENPCKLFTFTNDGLTNEVMGLVDFEGGGRMFGTLTDCTVKDLKPDMPVEMRFRKTFQDIEKQNYFWKIAPKRFTTEG